MTCSIVARDPVTGDLGVAVQTAMFAVGAIVPWARSGVGAVASQAIAEPAYGPHCLDAVAAGASAAEALARAQERDPASFLRQVGVVAADGSAATTTGEWCIDHAGHVLGDGFAVQANMMASPDVWPAVADAYRSSTSPFPRRLLDALRAGQAAGGDARGVMSAALLVVGAERTDPWARRSVDLRVDRSDDPLGDLAALLEASLAFDAFHEAVDLLSGGDGERALAAAERGLEQLPGEGNLRFVRAGALAATGDVERASREVRSLVTEQPGWETVLRSFAAKGLVSGPPGVTVDDLLA